jgi:hypothetical protein
MIQDIEIFENKGNLGCDYDNLVCDYEMSGARHYGPYRASYDSACATRLADQWLRSVRTGLSRKESVKVSS